MAQISSSAWINPKIFECERGLSYKSLALKICYHSCETNLRLWTHILDLRSNWDNGWIFTIGWFQIYFNMWWVSLDTFSCAGICCDFRWSIRRWTGTINSSFLQISHSPFKALTEQKKRFKYQKPILRFFWSESSGLMVLFP